eukprot:scaffold113632_cov54-Phaeocystis_antarctica.AAC.3
MACSSVCGNPSSLCVQSWVSDSVAMATCSEQSGSAVSISMPRRPVVGDSYRRYVIPVAVSGGSLRKGLVSVIAGERWAPCEWQAGRSSAKRAVTKKRSVGELFLYL